MNDKDSVGEEDGAAAVVPAVERPKRGSKTIVDRDIKWGEEPAPRYESIKQKVPAVTDDQIMSIAQEAGRRAGQWARVRLYTPKEGIPDAAGTARRNAHSSMCELKKRLKKKPLIDRLPALVVEVVARPAKLPSGAVDASGKIGVYIRFGGETGNQRKPRG